MRNQREKSPVEQLKKEHPISFYHEKIEGAFFVISIAKMVDEILYLVYINKKMVLRLESDGHYDGYSVPTLNGDTAGKRKEHLDIAI